MEREELETAIADMEWKIEQLDKMYEHARALVDLEKEIKDANEEIDLDYDLIQLRNTIDRLLEDCKEEKAELEGDLENIDDDTNEYLNHEYWQSQF